MKNYLLFMLMAMAVSVCVVPEVTMAQGEPGTEILLPPPETPDTDLLETSFEDPGEIVTPPDQFVLPDVPWGLDPNAYFLNLGVFFALIVALTQAIKKIFRKQDNKAFLINLIVTALVTALAFYLKLGALAGAEWWDALTWFGLGLLGSKLGYDVATRIGLLLHLIEKKNTT